MNESKTIKNKSEAIKVMNDLNSYIHNVCMNLFDEVKDDLYIYEINRIINILMETDCFWTKPTPLTQSGWEEKLFHHVANGSTNNKKIGKEIGWLLEVASDAVRDRIDIENEVYWVFRDGSNGTLWLKTQNQFLNLLRKIISCEETVQQLEIITLLHNIQMKKNVE